jgi:hypothetical protein
MTHFMFINIPPPPPPPKKKIMSFLKNMFKPDRRQSNTAQKICDLHDGYARQEYRHTLVIFNT